MNTLNLLRGRLRALSVCTLIIAAAFGSVAQAQVTVSGVRGVVTDASGNPASGVEVVITNSNTGFVRSATTGANGSYTVRNLPIGDGYSIEAVSAADGSALVSDITLNLGVTSQFDLALALNSGIEEVVVMGASSSALANVAVGPSAVFDLATLESAPSINRNITDVLRLDPRIFVDESRGGVNAVQCGGKNSRFNSLTVDGVRMNDSFGLNGNGYPTEDMPFSFDAVGQVVVELAPFDVEYGGFTACNINTVIKSGSNEFSGSVFYDYTTDSFRSDSLEGDRIVTGDFTEERYGVSIGGPIIEDKLFFFLAAEKRDGVNLFDRGALGSGAVNEVDITQAELDEIVDIARNIYQYDPGQIPQSLPNDDEKLLAKINWNINDMHRAEMTYIHNDGFNTVQSDGDNNEFEFQNHLYERGTELNSWSARLYSDWTSKFSTEVRIGYLEVDNRQESIGGTDFGEIRVETDNVDVYLGGDDSRQSNDLNYDNSSFALIGNYFTDNGHEISFGYERESLEVFNLFVQHSETEIRFDGIDNFRNGFADSIYYNNAPSQNPADAAAVWGYDINTVYIQDSFNVNDRLSVIAGLRYDWYTTSDRPVENPSFTQEYGFSNTNTLDGEGLIQPRVAFTFDFSDATQVRGGLGLFSGGDPNVWLSNNFSNNNVLQFGQRGRSFGYTDGSRSLFDSDVVYLGAEAGVPAGPGYGVPSELFNAVAGGVGDNFEINYLDPNFDVPSEWKFALGFTHSTESDYIIQGDLLFTEGQDTAIVLRGDLEQVGTTDLGYPQYDSVREASFVLTNADVGNESMVASINVSKSFENGFSFRAGYSYSDVEDVQPMTSSVTISNYTNRAFFDPQEQVLSPSNYAVEHRLVGLLTWEKEWFGDNLTTIALVGQYSTGTPYSRAFNGTINPYGFTPFLDFADNVLEPGAQRNAFNGPSWTKVDLRVEQEFAGFRDGDKATAAFIIDNLTNLISDDWGILDQVPFPGITELNQENPFSRVGDASRYEIRFEVRYDF